MATIKGFIKDWAGQKILPITRGELVLDQDGNIALNSRYFLAGENGSLYGLITAAERAMLGGGASGNSLSDLYTKVSYINSGLSFGGTTLSFYDASGTATPISITASNGVTLTTQGNAVNLGLTTLTTSDTTASQIIKSITVDKYGRVTAVSGSALTNAEIPTELTGKTITNGTLNGCVTSNKEIGDDEKAIVNKAYVDAKFTEVSGIATGSLKFGGGLGSTATATAALTKTNWNTYYKATADFDLNVSDLYDDSGLVGKTTVTVKTGDTLIVYPKDSVSKFVYVPSGDDITTITVQENGVSRITSALGDVTLNFAEIFAVEGKNNKLVNINLPKATSSSDGYLSKEDYDRFDKYPNSLAVTYTGEFNSGAGVYKIGTLKIGNTDNIIYGKNNISTLSLTDGTTNAYNPILKFTETGATDVALTFKGISGIQIKKNGNAIEFNTNIGIKSDSTNYLTSDGTNIGVKLGSLDSDGKTITEGLVNFSTIHSLAQQVATTTVFEEISYTLVGTDSSKYQYGNDKLKTAITVTI